MSFMRCRLRAEPSTTAFRELVDVAVEVEEEEDEVGEEGDEVEGVREDGVERGVDEEVRRELNWVALLAL